MSLPTPVQMSRSYSSPSLFHVPKSPPHLIRAAKYPTPVSTPEDSDYEDAILVGPPSKVKAAQEAFREKMALGYAEGRQEAVRKNCEVEGELDPDQVFVAASRARWSDGQVAFDVSYDSWVEDKNIQPVERYPITLFMDLTEQVFTNEQVAETVNHWIGVAKDWPKVRRNCLCCKNRAIKGQVLCSWCEPVYGKTIYA